jgi:flavorubredoxin
MVEYESTEKVLFSADGFGKFGTLDIEEDWACEARRYYTNICGKYGVQVQALLKKAANLDIQTICPLHGPILTENLEYYINLYDIWSKYQAETDGIFIAYCSIHGNTEKAAKKLYEILQTKTDKKISIADLAREDMAECVEDAFRYSKMIIASPTYDAALFPVMNDFLYHLKIKGYKNRTVGMIENGSWAPMSGKLMNEYLEGMKDVTVLPQKVTIKGAVKKSDIENLNELADAILE